MKSTLCMTVKCSRWLLGAALYMGFGAASAAAQIPYEMPPQFQDAPPAVTVPPNTKPLSQEELQRAEALACAMGVAPRANPRPHAGLLNLSTCAIVSRWRCST